MLLFFLQHFEWQYLHGQFPASINLHSLSFFSEKDDFLYHLKYPIENSSEYLEIATTRPETYLGDTAVAVHPDDERYKQTLSIPVTA